MSSTQEFIQLLRTDPESLESAPTNEQIIAANPGVSKYLDRPLTPGERAGFLQQWHMGYVRGTMADLGSERLSALRKGLSTELYEVPHMPHEVDELRLLVGMAAVTVAISKEE